MDIKNHNCELDLGSDSMLPKCTTWWGKFCRSCRKLALLSMKHPQTFDYFRSYPAVVAERQRRMLEEGGFIIHPLSQMSLFWSTLMILVNLAHMSLSPFRLFCVLDPIQEIRLHSTDKYLLFFHLMCFVDIIMRFNLGYVDKEITSVIMDRRTIAIRYLKTWLFLDLISCTPLAFVMLWMRKKHFISPRYILIAHILPLFRIVRIRTVTDALKTVTQYFSSSYIVQGIVRIPVLLLLSAHWGACLMYLSPVNIYYWTSTMPTEYNCFLQRTMTTGVNLTEYSIDYRYSKALVVVISAFFGTGFSMFHSNLPDELLVHSCIIVYAAMFMVFTSVFLVKSYLTIYDSSIRFHGLLNQVEEYMSYRQFPTSLKKRVRAFYEYRYQQNYFKEDDSLACLSEQLRDEVELNTSRSLIHKVKLFKNISPDTVGMLLGCLRPEVYLANDLVYSAGDYGDCMYFIATGTVAVYSSKGVEICHLEDGEYFGELALLMKDRKRPATFVAVETTQLYRLEAEDFSRYLMTHLELRERIEALASRRLHKMVVADEAINKEREQRLSNY